MAPAQPPPYRLARGDLNLSPAKAIENVCKRFSIAPEQRNESRDRRLSRQPIGGGIFQCPFEALENIKADDASANTPKACRGQKALRKCTVIGK